MVARGMVLLAMGCGRVAFDPLGPALASDAGADAFAIETCAVPELETAAGWALSNDPPVTAEVTGTRLTITLGDSQSGYGNYDSVNPIDLHDRCIFMSLVETPTPSNFSELLLAIVRSNLAAGLLLKNNNVASWTRQDTTVTLRAQVAYDPVMHRHWRLRESGGRLYWETSSDTISWRRELDLAVPLDVSQVTVSIAAGTYMPVASPGVARLDRIHY